MGEPDCVFCKIVGGAEPAFVVFEDDQSFAFLNRSQPTVGHTLVIPKTHAPDLLSASKEQAKQVMGSAWEVARLLGERLDPAGFSILQNNGQAGWQDVFHLHLHVVPRFVGDVLRPPWQPHPLDLDELAPIARRVGAELRGNR